MAHFTLTIDPLGEPLLTAFITVSEQRADALTKANQSVPTAQQIRALVDTGASATCVDPQVLQSLQLQPTGSTLVHTPSSGQQGETKDQYDVGLMIPGIHQTHPPLVRRTIPVISSDLSLQGIDALIGRDVLGECILIYNGRDKFFTLAF